MAMKRMPLIVLTGLLLGTASDVGGRVRAGRLLAELRAMARSRLMGRILENIGARIMESDGNAEVFTDARNALFPRNAQNTHAAALAGDVRLARFFPYVPFLRTRKKDARPSDICASGANRPRAPSA